MRALRWLTNAPAQARHALLAASLGWALDAFDVFLFALLTPALLTAFHTTKATIGILSTLTLLAAAAGGLLFGIVADRYGRTRALIASVLVYAVFTAACGLAWNLASLAVFRVLLGFGMGGEWASGAALVAESFPPAHRTRALGLMQSSFAVGYGAAALVVYVAEPYLGWRGVFLLGLLPALLTLWVRRHVREPEAWRSSQAAVGLSESSGLRNLFRRPLLPVTLALTAMNAACLFGFWGFNIWVPAYLGLPAARGGIGFAPRTMTLILLVMQAGMWFGYITFGLVADRFGRKRTYVAYLLAAAALLPLFSRVHTALWLVLLAPCVAFVATGYFTGFAAVTAEIFATRIRATAQGFTYNTGRIASAAAPFLVGGLADRHGFGTAFLLTSGAFVLAAALWAFIPETGEKRGAAVMD